MPSFLKSGGVARRNPRFPFELKADRLVFSSCEARLMDERARKNAEMPAFESNGGGGELGRH